MRMFARTLILSLSLAAALTYGVPKTTEIRRVDFKNFLFPWDEALGNPDSVPSISRWISPLPQEHVRIARGIHHFYLSGADEYVREHSPRISVNSVAYGDLDGDGVEEAAVHLNYSTGGSMNWDLLYVYKLTHGVPALLGVLESGSRGSGGLVRTSLTGGLLVLDFADPEKRVGDCCSKGYIRVRYRWQNQSFVEEGPREHGDLPLKLQ